MEEETTAKPQQGSWDNLETGDIERKEKVEFDINKPLEVSFDSNFSNPREYTSKDGKGVFYIFDVIHENKEKVIITSAWSLLRGLKSIKELAGKRVKILKSMVDGKQHYSVEELDKVEVQKV